jgi:protein ImuB
MKLAAAQALARELITLERNMERERSALQELAGWAYQFSSHVVLQPDGLLLETGASERLFGGRARLHRSIVSINSVITLHTRMRRRRAPRACWLIRPE